jgi:hypothetical protein
MENPSLPSLQSLVEKAKDDLAGRLSVPVSKIDLLEARNVVWSDSSLGCPQPGMLYMQVLTPGYLIRLRAEGRDYEYHAGRSRKVFLCPNPMPPVTGMYEEI